jgi:hypothetical protein
MPPPEPFRVFTRKLEELGLRYMVSGSIAAIYYGEPRLTNDVDIVVFMQEEDAAAFQAAFPDPEFYCPTRESILSEIARDQRGHFKLIHHETGFKADVYLAGRDELHRWALERIQVVELGDDEIRMAPPEYVIVRKLQFFREGGSDKHLRDVNRMLIGLGDQWDREVLIEMLEDHGLRAEWEQANSTGDD